MASTCGETDCFCHRCERESEREFLAARYKKEKEKGSEEEGKRFRGREIGEMGREGEP